MVVEEASPTAHSTNNTITIVSSIFMSPIWFVLGINLHVMRLISTVGLRLYDNECKYSFSLFKFDCTAQQYMC